MHLSKKRTKRERTPGGVGYRYGVRTGHIPDRLNRGRGDRIGHCLTSDSSVRRWKVFSAKWEHGRMKSFTNKISKLLIRPYCVATENLKVQLQILHFAVLRSG